MLLTLKSEKEIEIMHEANCIVHAMLDVAENNMRPGITTGELDALMEAELNKIEGATSAFKGYKNYPAVSCISVNEEIVHGIPGDRVIEDGDIVSVDFGVYYKGYAGDSARTIMVGNVSDEAKRLVINTKQGLVAGINAMVEGYRLNDVNRAIEAVAKEYGFGNTRGFCGHGIGKAMHEKPPVYNYVDPFVPNLHLRRGMVFALEPMFTLGSSKAKILEDKWTVITDDGSLACHWEVSVAITENGPRVLGDGFSRS